MATRRRQSGPPPARRALGPTKEQAARRQRLVGPKGDPRYAEHVLGVLYARGLIGKSALEAGHEYAVVWRMKFQAEAEKGTSWPTGGRAGAPATTETFAERQDRVGKKYAGAHRALRDAGRKAEAAVRRVAVFGDAVSAESVADLRAGLEAWARHWGFAPAPG